MSEEEKRKVARPFLKMVGGKTTLLDELVKRVPKTFGNYHEPFVGGGALYFRLAESGRLDDKIARLTDTNVHLISTFQAIQEDVSKVRQALAGYEDSKEAFYEAREEDPVVLGKDDHLIAAWMIFMNKTCFNGLWRVNRNGRFNTPFAAKKETRQARHLDQEKNLERVAAVLNRVKTEIHPMDFEGILNYAKKGDFVYLDPPYVPLSKTSDFARYSVVGFYPADQERLRDVALELKKRGVHVLLSNSSKAEDLYTDRRFKVDVVEAPRFINSKGDRRGAVQELLVR